MSAPGQEPGRPPREAGASDPGTRASRPVVSYRDLPAPPREHPYLSPRALRIDASARRQRLLQILAASTLVLAGALLVALAALAAARDTHEVTPYLVRVDDDGAVTGVQPLTEEAHPDRPMIQNAIRLFILNSRTVTTDRVAQRHLILRAYAYAGGRAVGLLNDYYRAHPPFARPDRTTATPRITSFLRLNEDDVFQVEWTEEIRNASGALVGEEPWRALLTVSVEPPGSIADALVNPLGIRVVDLDWTPLVTGPSPG